MRHTPVQVIVEKLETRALLSAGALDPSFGTGGKVFESVNGAVGFSDVVAEDDGSLIVAANAGIFADSSMRLLHYNADGSRDLTWGTGGETDIDFGSGKLFVQRLRVLSDASILVVGQKQTGETSSFALAKIKPDGALDTSFGGSGILTIDVGNNGGNDYATDAIQSANGQIYVAGAVGAGFITVLRLSETGVLDSSFGINGAAVAAVDMNKPRIALAPDGRIVAASPGMKDIKLGTNIVRFTTAGQLDTGFSGDGVVFYEGFSSGAVFVNQDNRAITIGSDASGNIIVRRQLPGGGGDVTLGGTGLRTYPSGFNNVTINDGKAQSDGKFIFVGQAGNTGEANDFLIGRLNADLSQDASFGTAGLTFTDVKGFDAANGVAIDSSNRIIAAGDTFTTPESSDESGALVRLVNGEASATLRDGNWIINGTSGNDRITVGILDDTFTVTITGPEALNAAVAMEGVTSVVVSGGAGRDRITIDQDAPTSIVNGNAGNDTIFGGNRNDLLIGAAGNDRIDGGLGADTLIGNAGRDTISYEFRIANLAVGIGDIPGGSGESHENDLISNSVETIIGGSGNDRIAGSNIPNVLYGGPGDDVIVGFGGDDTLFGNDGKDRLVGGVGGDLIDGGGGMDRAELDFADTYISVEFMLE